MNQSDRDYLEESSRNYHWTTTTRDSQRQRVYRSGWATRAQMGDGWDLENAEDVEKFVRKVITSNWWKQNITPFSKRTFNGEIRIKVSRRTNTAVAMYCHCNGAIHIELPTENSKWAWNKLVVLHELAHYPSSGHGVPAHGWLFCSIFLDLIWRFMSNDVRKILVAEYDKRNVTWRRPRQLSDETRQMLSERMTAMAAARWEGHEKAKVEDVPYVPLTHNQNWEVGQVVWDFQEDGTVLDYWHDKDKSQLCVTEQSIVHVAEHAQYLSNGYDPRAHLSMIGLLKKMKTHSPDKYAEAVRNNQSLFYYLPS